MKGNLLLALVVAISCVGVASVASAGSGGVAAPIKAVSGLGLNPDGSYTFCVEPKIKGDLHTSGDVKLNFCSKGFAKITVGKQGRPGVDGKNGIDGKNGTNGTNGTNGAPGATGPAGPAGAQGPAGPQGTPAPTMTHVDGTTFTVNNPTVVTTLDGVQFGPYADGGEGFGSLIYHGLDGHKLSELAQFSATFKHKSFATDYGDGSPIGSPYMRVFLNDNNDDVLFDPTMCATVVPTENDYHTYELTTGTKLRYDDDACGADYTPMTYAQIVAAHGNDVISGIRVSAGATGGDMLTALLRSLSVNGTDYVFGAP